jgi:hypothetical protein
LRTNKKSHNDTTTVDNHLEERPCMTEAERTSSSITLHQLGRRGTTGGKSDRVTLLFAFALRLNLNLNYLCAGIPPQAPSPSGSSTQAATNYKYKGTIMTRRHPGRHGDGASAGWFRFVQVVTLAVMEFLVVAQAQAAGVPVGGASLSALLRLLPMMSRYDRDATGNLNLNLNPSRHGCASSYYYYAHSTLVLDS